MSPSAAATSSQVHTHTVSYGTYSNTYVYTYDDNGNITSVSDLFNTISYWYDNSNQLIQAGNSSYGIGYTWSYDCSGNITNQTNYLYDSGLGFSYMLDSYGYVYEDSEWGDLLTTYEDLFNGTTSTYTYDAIGNLTTGSSYSYIWEHGRQLAAIDYGSSQWDISYNADGIRTSRTKDGVTYQYVYNGTQLTSMTVGNNVLYFTYDDAGRPFMLNLNGVDYYYITNIQGDVIAIIDTSGNMVIEYDYDPWGVPFTSLDYCTVSALNPLLYRGYVYDKETGLYYLNSRYYDPSFKRFISPDTVFDTAVGLQGYNLYAYCGNNPVIGYDPTGHWNWGWEEQAALGTTVLLVGIAILLAAPTGGSSLLFGAVAVSSTTAVAAGGAMAITGTVMVGDALIASACEANSKPTSRNQMQHQVESGQAPKEVDRVDGPHNDTENSQNHIHFKDGTAINQDGSLSHKGNGIPNITKAIAKWILDNGWRISKF